ILPNALGPGPFRAHTMDARFGDLDGDGNLDLYYAVYHSSTGPARLLMNTGDGTFRAETAQRTPHPLSFPDVHAVEMLDIDGDGDLDLCVGVTNFTYAFYVLENDGHGFFRDVSATKAPPINGMPAFGQLYAFDIENDGDLDLISNARGGAALHIWVND